MRIYFAGAIRGGRQLQPIYAEIVNHLQEQGHHVLSSHVASKSVMTEESASTDSEIYKRDISWLNDSDVVIADVTVPSLGVGYEIGYALHSEQSKPILCICQEQTNCSAMLRGNPNLKLIFYDSAVTAVEQIELFLHESKNRTPSQ